MNKASSTLDETMNPLHGRSGPWSQRELVEQWKLAWPIFVGQLASIGIAFSDVVMSGSISTQTLAGVAVGSSFFIIIMFGLAGFFYGVNPIVAQLAGAQKNSEIASVVRQALWLAVVAGGVGLGLCLVSGLVVTHMGLEAEVQAVALSFLVVIGWGCSAYCGYRALHGYSSSLGHTKAMMRISFASLIVNVALNWILIYGHLGMPAIGGAGCAVATALTLWVNLVLMVVVVKRSAVYRATSPFSKLERPSWRGMRELVKVGSPIAASFLVEGSTFAGIGLLVAPMGTLQVASHQIALNFNSLIFMIPTSIGVAITTRVGQAIGAHSLNEARKRGLLGMAVCLVFGALASLSALLAGEQIAAVYANDRPTILAATSLFSVIALMHMFDALQSACSALIRAYKETDTVMYIQTGAFWGLALPVGCVLGLAPSWVPFAPAEPMGARGFWFGLTFGLGVAAVALVILASRVSAKAMTAGVRH